MSTQAWLDILRCPRDGERIVAARRPVERRDQRPALPRRTPGRRRRGHREAGLARAHDGPRRSHEPHLRPAGALLRLERAPRHTAVRRPHHRAREPRSSSALSCGPVCACSRSPPDPVSTRSSSLTASGPPEALPSSICRSPCCAPAPGAAARTGWTRCSFRPTPRTCRSPTTRSTPSFTLAASNSSASPDAPWTSSSGWPNRAPWWPGATRASAPARRPAGADAPCSA